MTSKLPKYCEVLEEIIRKIAAEKGEKTDDLKASLLTNIRDGKGVDCATNTESTSTAHEHLPKKGSIATKLKGALNDE